MAPFDDAAVAPGPLTVAAVQAESVPGDVSRNAVTAARLVRQAAEDGATVVVFPELFLPAYHPPVLGADPHTDLPAGDCGTVGDSRLDPLRTAAASNGTVVVIGAAVRHPDGRRTCSALVVDRGGSAVVGYDKQHLCGPDEKSLFTPGRRGATLTVDGWRLGLGICYDGCFPEHARAAVDDGAHGYLCPSAYVIGSEHRRDIYYAARALDNTMYVVFANQVDGQSPWRFNGAATVYDPQGQPMRRAAEHGEAVVTAVLDPTELVKVRSAQRMLADRRSDQGPDRGLLIG